MKLTDLPRFFPMDMYNRTREVVRERHRNVEGVEDVLEFGLIPTPGISDMDFYIAITPEAHVELPGSKNLTEDEKYILSHLIFVLSADCVKDLRYIDPWLMQLDPLLHTESPYALKNVPELTEEERHALSYGRILTGWLLLLYEVLGKSAAMQEIEAREFLETVKGIGYCYRELVRAGKVQQDRVPQADQFYALRDEWFDLSQEQQLQKTVEAMAIYKDQISMLTHDLDHTLQSVMGSMETPTTISKSNRRMRKLLKKYPRSLIIDTNGALYVFQKECTEPRIEFQVCTSPFTPQHYMHGTYVLPISFSSITNHYLKEDGPLSKYYQQHAGTDLESLPLLDHPALQKRAQVNNRTLQGTAHVHGGKPSCFTFGFSPNPPKSKGAPLRARLGGTYDRLLQRLSQTVFGCLLQRKTAIVTLDSRVY